VRVVPSVFCSQRKEPCLCMLVFSTAVIESEGVFEVFVRCKWVRFVGVASFSEKVARYFRM
jgi:hypothetical protein